MRPDPIELINLIDEEMKADAARAASSKFIVDQPKSSFSKDQARDLLLNQASIYGTAQELARMADTQGQREIAENIVKLLSRAVLDAAELYYQSLKP